MPHQARDSMFGASVDPAPAERWGIPELFVISQTALPALLFLPGTQGLRLPLRIGAFLISFALLARWFFTQAPAERDARHPAVPWIVAILGLVVLMFFHPQTSTLTGGAAQLGLYVCVFAPLFWAPSMVRTPIRLRRIMALLLVCNGLNAVVGVLQVYDPARWLPDEFSRIVTQSELGLGPVTYVGASGDLVVRPPGLFDTPGAVAGPGGYAALLGLIFAATRIRRWQRVAAAGLAFAGFAAIYLSHVRISLVVAAAMMIAYGVILFLQRRVATATVFAGVAGAALAGAFVFAVVVGGGVIAERFATLFEADPFTVYYTARGGQLSYALTDSLFEFPFGAGLARWGMSAMYFGRPTVDSPSLWAEIQLAGWILDGGLLLMALYCATLAVTAARELRLAREMAQPLVAACAAAVFAANLGPVALIFSFTPFVTQIGVQYWFLAGALHGVAQEAQRQAETASAAMVA
jgi:hypothetical protein